MSRRDNLRTTKSISFRSVPSFNVESADDGQIPIKKGWILKQVGGIIRNRWKKIFVVVENGVLRYYAKEMEHDEPPYGEELLGEMQLMGAMVLNTKGLNASVNPTRKIRVVDHDRSEKELYFFAETIRDARDWAVSIQENILKMNNAARGITVYRPPPEVIEQYVEQSKEEELQKDVVEQNSDSDFEDEESKVEAAVVEGHEIVPRPGFVLKTFRQSDNEKVFINVCENDEIRVVFHSSPHWPLMISGNPRYVAKDTEKKTGDDFYDDDDQNISKLCQRVIEHINAKQDIDLVEDSYKLPKIARQYKGKVMRLFYPNNAFADLNHGRSWQRRNNDRDDGTVMTGGGSVNSESSLKKRFCLPLTVDLGEDNDSITINFLSNLHHFGMKKEVLLSSNEVLNLYGRKFHMNHYYYVTSKGYVKENEVSAYVKLKAHPSQPQSVRIISSRLLETTEEVLKRKRSKDGKTLKKKKSKIFTKVKLEVQFTIEIFYDDGYILRIMRNTLDLSACRNAIRLSECPTLRFAHHHEMPTSKGEAMLEDVNLMVEFVDEMEDYLNLIIKTVDITKCSCQEYLDFITPNEDDIKLMETELLATGGFTGSWADYLR